MINLYWPVYKSIERETLELSNQIHFDDGQLSIYSIKIAELLIRCSVEIEAISKDLYFREGGISASDDGENLYFDTDCLQLLEDKWVLSKKKLILSAPNFYFESEGNKIITPLNKANKRGTSGSKWKQAYQAVKHNRVNELKQGNVKNLLHALGALFILNLYYKDDVFSLSKDATATTFPLNVGSEIFAIKLHRIDHYDGNQNYAKSDDFDECTYYVRYTEETAIRNKKALEEMNTRRIQLSAQHPKFKAFLKTSKVEDYKGDNFWYDILGDEEYFRIVKIAGQEAWPQLSQAEYEAVLNKNLI